MKMLTFADRNAKEILRDPLNLAFGLGFPIVLILLLSAIQANVPVSLFEISHLTPGITVFGLSFMTLFSATIIAKDRGSSLLQRLYTTPLTAKDFIFGYTLPILPIALAQSVICYIVALFLGLPLTVNILYALLLILPAAIFFIALGLLCGSVFTDKQVAASAGHCLPTWPPGFRAPGLIWSSWVVYSRRSLMPCPLYTRWSWSGPFWPGISRRFFLICFGCWDMPPWR